MDPEKKGWLTSEFWVMLFANLVAMLVLFNFIPKEDAHNANEVLTQTIQNVFALLMQLGTIWKYIQSRMEVKKSVIEGVATMKAAESAASVSINKVTGFLLALLLCSVAYPLHAQDGAAGRGVLTADWPVGAPKIIPIDNKAQPVKAEAAKAEPAKVGDTKAGDAKAKLSRRRELTFRQRERLGLAIPKLMETVKTLHESGEIDEETSVSEIAVMVLDERNSSHAAGMEGIDRDTILAWLEKILPLILALLGL